MMFAVIIKSLIGLAFIFLVGCNENSTSNKDDYKIQSSLKYFGFAVVDCGWDDPNDNIVKTNYIDEISGFTNIGQMCVYSADEYIGNRLYRFSNASVKAVLNIEAILFQRTSDPSSASGDRLSLRPNALALWYAFVNLNKEVLVPKHIAALYVADEPVWNGLNPTDFERALSIVKSSQLNLPTFAIEAHPVVDKMLAPKSLDWVGFDRYDTTEPARNHAWLSDLETVRAARTRSDQKIVIVASTQWLPSYQSDAGIEPEDMESMFYSYYDIAASDPHVIALAGYIWPGGLDHPEQLGARNLPENVQKSLRVIGEQIIDR